MDLSGGLGNQLFAVGIVGLRSSHYNMRQQRQRDRDQLRTQRIRQVMLEPFEPFKNNNCHKKKWLLIPSGDEYVDRFISESKYGFASVYNKFMIEHTKPLPFLQSSFYFPIPPEFAFGMNETRSTRIETHIYKNQTFRWKMKRLIHKWLLGRIKTINNDDIVTCEPPVKPIIIYDWSNRARYTFEASTLYRDFREKIFKAENLFVNSQLPKNPFTNQTYSLGQLHFITEGLLRHGISDWALQGLRSVEYSLPRFKIVYKSATQREVLKRCLTDVKNTEYMDLIYDYIMGEYVYHGIHSILPYNGWYWFLENHPDWPLIQSWRALCFQYYENFFLKLYGPHSLEDNHGNSAVYVHMSLRDMHQMYRDAVRGV